MSEPRVLVFTTEFCGWCERAKALLATRGIDYREERLDRSPGARDRLEALNPGARSFPQIVIDGVAIGGYRELVVLDREGRLDSLAS